jgi:phage terminase small subunit
VVSIRPGKNKIFIFHFAIASFFPYLVAFFLTCVLLCQCNGRARIMAELNSKQKTFCEEYILDNNAAQSAIRAGYSEKTARAIGAKLLTKVDIRNYIALMRNTIIRDKEKIINDNIEFWRKVRDSATEDTKDKLKASEMMGRYAGMFVDKVELSGAVASVPLEMDPEARARKFAEIQAMAQGQK